MYAHWKCLTEIFRWEYPQHMFSMRNTKSAYFLNLSFLSAFQYKIVKSHEYIVKVSDQLRL